MTHVFTHDYGRYSASPPASASAEKNRRSLAPKLAWLAGLFLLLGMSAPAWAGSGIYGSYVIVNGTYRKLDASAGGAPNFGGAALGTFSPSSALLLNGGEVLTFKNGGDDITGASLSYRVYATGQTPPVYSSVTLPFGCEFAGACPNGGSLGLSNSGDQKWITNTANINLLSGLPAGNYSIDVRANAPFTFTGGGGGSGTHQTSVHTATFTITSSTNLLAAGFETGLDGFAFVNQSTGTTPNRWFRGTVAGGSSSSNSIYVSDNVSGTTNTYAVGTASTSHAHVSVTQPSGASTLTVQFDYKGNGELFSGTIFDYLQVFIAPSSFTPVAGTLPSGTGVSAISPQYYNQGATYGSANLSVAAAPGNYRLIFVWRNDGSGGTQNAASVDNVVVNSVTPTPLNGLYTINNTLTTAGRNFQTFAAAVNSLNSNGISGAVTFDVSAGQTFTEDVPAITATGTSTNTITFQKTTGTNPVVRPTGGAGSNDAGISISGGDYFTFDGIDVNIFTGSALEYGYLIRNASATNGATNNTIRNATITLNRNNTNSVGVLQSSSSLYGGVASSATATGNGTNDNNTYNNLNIRNASGGLLFAGATSAPEAGTLAHTNSIGDPATAGDIGSTGQVFGLQAVNQQKLTVRDNTVRNLRTTATTSAIYGLWLDQIHGSGANASNIYNNRIGTLSRTSTTGVATIDGIRVGVISGTHTVNVYNNLIYDLATAYTGTASAIPDVHGIIAQPSTNGSTSASVINIAFNTVRIGLAAGVTASSTAYRSGVVGGTQITLRNNNFTNFTGAQSGAATHYAAYTSSATRFGNTGSSSDNNNFFLANTTNGTLILGNTTVYNTVAAWSAVTSTPTLDANSLSTNPNFDANFSPLSATLDNKGVAFGSITTDINAVTRNATTPDIGAFEYTAPLIGDITVTTLVSPVSTGCVGGTNQTVTVRIQNVGAAAINLATTNVTVTGSVTGTNPITFSNVVLNTGSIAINGTQDVVLSTTYDMSAGGTYTFNSSASFTGDLNTANDALSTGNTRTVVTPVSIPLTTVTFTGYTGSNLGTVFPGWSEGVGATAPTIQNSVWTNLSFPAPNTTAQVNLFGNARREWIISPKFVGTANSRVGFRAGIAATGNTTGLPSGTPMAGTDDVLQVMVSTDCGGTYTPILTFNSANSPTNGALTYYSADLSAYAGQQVIVAFFASDGTIDDPNDYALHLDDIKIEATPTVDVGITALVAPAAIGCYSATEPVIVRIRNYGSAAQSNIPVNVVVTGAVSTTISNTYAGPLAAGASFDYTVGTLNMTTGGTYTFAPTTALVGDAETLNDALSLPVSRTSPTTAALPQRVNFQGFNSTNLPTLNPGWREAQTTSTTVPSGTNSFWNVGTFTTANGNQTAKVNLFSTSAREWIVGPKVNATGLTKLTFDAGITDFASNTGAPDPNGMAGTDDVVQVMISTDCGSSYSPIYTFNAANPPSNGSLTNYLVDLSSYAGQGIIIGFFASEGTGTVSGVDYDFHLDNISLRDEPTVDIAPTALASPLPGAGCYTATEAVGVTVRNTGTAVLDFAANALTATVSVTGTVTTTLTGGLTTGTLAVGATTTVPVGTFNMSANGTYNFAVTATVAGDGDATNDVMAPAPPSITKAAPTVGTLSSTLSTFCGGTNSTTLSVSASANGTVKYQESANGTTGWADVGGTGNSTVISGITTTTFYRAINVCGAAQSTPSNVVQVTNTQPNQAIAATPPAVCEGSSFNIAVTGSAGRNSILGFNTTPSTIADNTTLAGASSAITLSGAGSTTVSAATRIRVTVNITHAYDDDVDLFLVGPGGTGAMLLASDVGNSGGDNFINTIFDTNASNIIGTTGNNSAPFTGTYRAEGTITTVPDRTGAAANGTPANTYNAVIPAAALNGLAINGAWTLRAFDDASIDAGVLNNWSIEITDPAIQAYTHTITGPGSVGTVAYSGTGNVTGTATVTGAPVGTNTYTVTTTDLVGCARTQTVNVTVNPRPTATLTGNGPFCGTASPQLTGTLSGTGPYSITYSINGVAQAPVTGIAGPGFTINPPTFSATTVPVTQTYAITAVSDANCTATAFPTSVTVTANPPATVDAGPATATICTGGTYTLAGTRGGGATGSTWTTSGDGGFSPNANMLSATYTPGAADILAGTVTLTLTSSGQIAPCSAATDNLVLTITGTTTWVGTNTDWYDPTNWTACVPNATISAIIPNTVIKPAISIGLADVKNLTIQAGGVLTVSGTGNLDVYGTFTTASAAGFVASAGTTTFQSTAPVVPAAQYFNVTLTGDKTLTGAASIYGDLDLTSGKITLGAFNLTLDPPTGPLSTITGASATGYVVTSTSGVAGQLIFARTGGAPTARQTVFFPIGTATSYTPAQMTFSTMANFTYVGAARGSVSDVVPIVVAIDPTGTHVVNKTWELTWGAGTMPVGENATVQLRWNSSDEGSNFFGICTVKHFTGGAWTNRIGDYALPVTIGGQLSRERIRVTNFSPFAVEDYTQPLPVEITGFTAIRNGQNADLRWTTASEKNSRGFNVQVSTTGKDFRTLGFIASQSPNSTTTREYTFVDTERGKIGLRIYRLESVDLDGKTAVSPARTVTFDGNVTTTVTPLPNPFTDRLAVTVVAAAAGSAQLTLVDAVGRTVYTQTLPVTAGLNELAPTLPTHLITGTYTLVAVVDGQRFRTHLVKQ